MEPLTCQSERASRFPKFSYHFSIRFPSIHASISDRNQAMSTEGSYPLVAFPMSKASQSLILIQYANSIAVEYVPSASVVPLTSMMSGTLVIFYGRITIILPTTCTTASACRRSSRNLFPKPLPWCAPGTKPATSRSSIGTDRVPATQDP